MQTKPLLMISLISLCTFSCGGDKINFCDPSSPLYEGAKEQGICGVGETGWDEDISDPDDSKPNAPHFNGGCYDDISYYQHWLEANGHEKSGPLNEEGEYTNIADAEWAPFMMASPSSLPLNKIGRPHYPGFPSEFTCAEASGDEWEGSNRTCLIGNFAVYLDGVVPTTHPRVPWSQQITDQIGHPEKWGRVTGVGDGCCGVISEESLNDDNLESFYKTNLLYSSVNSTDCQEHIDFWGTHPMLEYPRSNLGQIQDQAVLVELKKADASAWTQCLNNGGEFDLADAAQSATQRNSLVWLNLDNEYWDDVVQGASDFAEEGVFYWGEVLELLELFGWYGFEDEVETPPFFAFTGICANKCTAHALILDGYRSWWSGVECPLDQYCVLPNFDFEEDISVEGFCAIETFSAPPDDLGLVLPLQDLDVAPLEESMGLPNHYVVNLMTYDLEEVLFGLSFNWDQSEHAELTFTGVMANELGSRVGILDGDSIDFVAGIEMDRDLDYELLLETAKDTIEDGRYLRVVHTRHGIRMHTMLQFMYY